MSIGLLMVDCYFGDSLSLKDKRRILSSLTERLRKSFNIALCEIEYQQQWQRAKLAIVLINTDWRMLQQSSSRILETIERDGRVDILASAIERLR
ncbi:MAG: DUF503 domain-containing protein [candidate division WOR-3 bacterium]|uniref:DUF503 domain-containing protein n=1 Tax=candidate division WOR-3 bacterium TaxID=2052148 RepID=A0A7C1SMW9_UNCW3|nr:DUF503 domain-containing protein [candidate division WOR-3 bacterium]